MSRYLSPSCRTKETKIREELVSMVKCSSLFGTSRERLKIREKSFETYENPMGSSALRSHREPSVNFSCPRRDIRAITRDDHGSELGMMLRKLKTWR